MIDLKDSVLRFPHLDVALPFLPPHQIPAGAIGRPPPAEQQAAGVPLLCPDPVTAG